MGRGPAFIGEGALKSVRGVTAASRDLLWLAIMLALYYTSHYGSLQMTSFASDLDNVTRRHTHWSFVPTCGSPVCPWETDPFPMR